MSMLGAVKKISQFDFDNFTSKGNYLLAEISPPYIQNDSQLFEPHPGGKLQVCQTELRCHHCSERAALAFSRIYFSLENLSAKPA